MSALKRPTTMFVWTKGCPQHRSYVRTQYSRGFYKTECTRCWAYAPKRRTRNGAIRIWNIAVSNEMEIVK